jgi:type II restriction enzyme
MHNKIREAQKILKAMGLPAEQQNEMSALTLLALAGIKPRSNWRNATRSSLTITKGIMTFVAGFYDKKYAPNTRETFRRHVLHQFTQARLVDYNPDNPDIPTNSPNAHYALSIEALDVIKTYGTKEWNDKCIKFKQKLGNLLEIYRKKRSKTLIPIHLPEGKVLKLSPGKHNKVQAAVVEDFVPHFAPGASLVYLGDTAQKQLFVDNDILSELHIPLTEHDKLPDVLLYDRNRNRIFLIEAVTSHGPMTPKRVIEFKEMLSQCTKEIVFLSAFPDFIEFRKHLKEIAWETEVWISEIPDHLIHFNGDKFL